MILLSVQIPLETHQSDNVVGSNGALEVFLSKILSSMVEKNFILLFKPFGWFFLMVILNIVHKINHLTK
jgi:hypothetical protein